VTGFATQAQWLDLLIELQPRIRRLIGRRVGRAAAADLTQDLFLRLRRIATPLLTKEDASRYLMRIAMNAAIDHKRIEGGRTELLTGMQGLLSDAIPDPLEQVLIDEKMSEVDAALAELPAKCRDVLWLSRVEGLTHTEIAERLGVSRSLVEKYVVRAVLHCRVRLDAATDE
jgi:RNA polymerase sigma factor (sigma-70 family)